MKKAYLALACCILAVSPATTNAATLVDTGTPTGTPDDNRTLGGSSNQDLAGLVSFSQNVVVSSAQIFGFLSGTLSLKIYKPSSTVNTSAPFAGFGALIYQSSAVAVNAGTFSNGVFLGVEGISQSLSAGEYWFLFDATSSSSGAARDGAPNPLRAYALTNTANPGSFSAAQFGIRVFGDTVGAVPEPAAWALLIGGFGFIGGAMRRARKATVTVSYA